MLSALIGQRGIATLVIDKGTRQQKIAIVPSQNGLSGLINLHCTAVGTVIQE
jgi:hypothetical protein